MLHSLRVRLPFIFMLLVIVAVGAVGLLSSFITSQTIRSINADNTKILQTKQVRVQNHFFSQSLSIVLSPKANAEISPAMSSRLLSIYDQQHRNLQAMQALVVRLGLVAGLRIVVLDDKNMVIADSNSTLLKQKINMSSPPGDFLTSSKTPTLFIFADQDPQANGAAILFAAGSLEDPLIQPQNSPFASDPSTTTKLFLNQANVSTLLDVLFVGLVLLLFALICSHQLLNPIKALTLVANRLEQGDFDQRVTIRTKSEIGILARAFNTMADSLQRSEQLRRQLVSDVAHELRTPLTNIRGYLEALQDEVIEPTQEVISSLNEEALLLSRLVTDLQELSLAESGQLRLARRPVILEDIIIKSIQALKISSANKMILLHTNISPYLPLINADPERMGQVLRNLLSNAILHTPVGGKIRIEACVIADEIRVSVQDNGKGIGHEHLPYIFERFYRADTSRSRSTGGSGLGLAIVKQMVEAHGGRVEAESRLGDGSCFTFVLPPASALTTPGQNHLNDRPALSHYYRQ